MYKNILIGIDLNHEADYARELHVAAHLTEDNNARLTALSVLPPIPAYVAGQVPKEAVEAASEDAMHHLRRIIGPTSEIASEIRHGAPADELMAYAAAHDIDCIVIASHRPGLKDYFLGSTAARVVRHAACSVHVIR